MKNKNYNEESEIKFEEDEPKELQENSYVNSALAKKRNKRPSTSKRSTPKKKKRKSISKPSTKAKIAINSNTSAKGEDTETKSSKKDKKDDEEDLNDKKIKNKKVDDKNVDEKKNEASPNGGANISHKFIKGAFVVLKSDFSGSTDPKIWKISGKTLLRKYVPFEQDGKTFYRSTYDYSRWTNNTDNYYLATVIPKQQTRQEQIIEFQRDSVLNQVNLNIQKGNDEVLNDKKIKEIKDENVGKKNEASPNGGANISHKFINGAFVILKSDFNGSTDPRIWKIDGKALLRKYVPFEQDGKTFYRSTSVYSGWKNNTDKYYLAAVISKLQTRKEHIIEFQRDSIQDQVDVNIQSHQKSSTLLNIDKLNKKCTDILQKVFTKKQEKYVRHMFHRIDSTLASSSAHNNVPINKSNNRSKNFKLKRLSRLHMTKKKRKFLKIE